MADPCKLVFIDEIWIKTDMLLGHSCGPKERRVHGSTPVSHLNVLTFIAALRHDWIAAPCVLDGPAEVDTF